MLTVLFFVVTLLSATQGQLPIEDSGEFNNTEIQYDVDQALTQANNFITSFLDLIVKLVKSISNVIEEFQTGNNTRIDFSQLTESIRTAFNDSNNTCTELEHKDVSALVLNTAKSIQNCYANDTVDIEQFIPNTEDLVSDIALTIKNITGSLNNCFKDFTMILTLPGCIRDVVSYASQDYNVYMERMNSTMLTGIEIVTNFAQDTTVCMRDVGKEFAEGIGTVLMSFVECMYN